MGSSPEHKAQVIFLQKIVTINVTIDFLMWFSAWLMNFPFSFSRSTGLISTKLGLQYDKGHVFKIC